MTSYTWSAGSPGNANNASNWTPSAVPGASDDVIFDSTSIHDCVWDIAQIGAIDIREAFPGTVDFQVDITAIQGLKVSRQGPMFTSGARRITFSGTPAHNSGATYILLGTSDSPFPSATETVFLLKILILRIASDKVTKSPFALTRFSSIILKTLLAAAVPWYTDIFKVAKDLIG